MNRNLVLRSLGLVLSCEAAAMVLSLLVSFYYNEGDTRAFAHSIIITGLVGLALSLVPVRSKTVGYREGFTIATLSWLLTAGFGCLPYMFSGALCSFADAFFETMSGFTTTGATVFANIEAQTHGILFWRSLTHWLGGMGTIVLILALIPSLKIAGMQLYKAEVPGPTKSRVLPRIAQTARELYKIYLIITGVEVSLLLLAGMPLFDSFIHSFGSVATAGFSSKNISIGAYDSLVIELIIVFFIIICGMNFALHYRALRGDLKSYLRDPEARLYLGVITVSVLLITINLVQSMGYSPGEALRASLFTVPSVITTTGFAIVDYDRWPDFSRLIIVILMFFGGCAGSTSGAIKNVRMLILFKSVFRQIVRLIHPQAVVPVRLGREVVSEEVVTSVQTFFFIYMFILTVATAYISFLGIDLISAFTAAAATLGNIGPGLGLVGPMSNYAVLPGSGKVVLSFCMLLGRLEIYTVLVVLSARFWR